MKINWLFSILLSLCFIQASHGQEIKVFDGPEYRKMPKTYFSEFIGEIGTELLTLRRKGRKDYIIEAFDEKLSKTYTTPVTIPVVNKKETDLMGLFILDGKLVLLSTHFDKKTEIKRLYGAYFNHKTGKLNGTGAVLGEIPAKKAKSAFFTAVTNTEANKLLVVIRPNTKGKELEKFGFTMYDGTLKKMWNKNVQMPYADKAYLVNRYLVDRKGNIHMNAQIFIPKSGSRSPGYYYEVFSYFHEEDEIKQYEINLGDDYISEIALEVSEDNLLVGSGFYSEKNGNRMKGVYYFQIDPESKKVAAIAKKDFSTAFLKEFMSERKAEKNDAELSNYEIRSIIARKGGGAAIVAEYYRLVVRTYTDQNGNTRTTYTHKYNDIIVANVNKEGKMDWIAHIPKRQTASSGGYFAPGFVGISVVEESNGTIRILYNDNPKNYEAGADPSKPKALTNLKKAVLSMVTLSPDGKMKKDKVINTINKAQGEKSFLLPRHSIQWNNHLIMRAQRGKNYKLVKVEF